MSIENKTPEFKPGHEQEETFSPSLAGFLEALQQEGITTLSAEEIMKQLDQTGTAIVTRDFGCGIRISRGRSKAGDYRYRTWTTNDLEDPEHPLSKKFGRKDLTI